MKTRSASVKPPPRHSASAAAGTRVRKPPAHCVPGLIPVQAVCRAVHTASFLQTTCTPATPSAVGFGQARRSARLSMAGSAGAARACARLLYRTHR
jgi:hypothetical protein